MGLPEQDQLDKGTFTSSRKSSVTLNGRRSTVAPALFV